MFMVCMIHILGQGGVLAASQRGSVSYNTFWFLEVCAYCAVDGFAIISGYVSSNRAPKWNKLADMWLQVLFYSFVLTAVFSLLDIGTEIGTVGWFGSLLPVTANYFWYFSAYCALFFAMPMLNRFIESLEINTARKAMIILIVLFSVIGLPADSFSTQSGYSAIWLMVLYCIGALVKKVDLFAQKKSVTLVITFLILSVLSWGVLIVFGTGILIRYISPTILFNAVILVVLFSRIKIKGTLVKRLAPLAFGIYLFQLNYIIWTDFLKDSMTFIITKPVAVGVCYVVLFAFVLFATGLIVEWFRVQIAKVLRIQVLSQKIVDVFGAILSKAIRVFQ